MIITDYRLTNSGINLYAGETLIREISQWDFIDFMGWDFLEGVDRLTEPDEDFSYYLDKMNAYLDLEMEIDNPGPYDLPPIYPI